LMMAKGRRSGGMDDYRNNAEPSANNFIRQITNRTSQTPKGTTETVKSSAGVSSPKVPTPPPPTNGASTSSEPFVASDTSSLEEGNRVEHPKFGKGTVKKMDVNGTDRKAIIHFDTTGEKTLLLSFAKLRILR